MVMAAMPAGLTDVPSVAVTDTRQVSPLAVNSAPKVLVTVEASGKPSLVQA